MTQTLPNTPDDAPSILRPPRRTLWGDYGHILLQGLSPSRPRADEPVQHERVGPYVPPLVFPRHGEVIVTDAFRRELEAAGFRGLSFREVILTHVVRLDWRAWDLTAAQPQEHPVEGEPENYILARPHDPALAESMPPLWELRAPHAGIGRKAPAPAMSTEELAQEQRVAAHTRWGANRSFRGVNAPEPELLPGDQEASRARRIALRNNPPPYIVRREGLGDLDVFRLSGVAEGGGHLFVSARLRQWLERVAAEHVAFRPAIWDEAPSDRA